MQNLDSKNLEIVEAIVVNRDKLQGPRVGDYVKMPNGMIERFAHDWGDSIQTCYAGSFHLGSSGNASMSGSLNPSIEKSKLKLTDVIEYGQFWIFSHNEVRAHNAAYFKIPCRVYEYHL